jgi:hypothetical protein
MPLSEKLIPEINMVESLFTLNKLLGPGKEVESKKTHPLTVSTSQEKNIYISIPAQYSITFSNHSYFHFCYIALRCIMKGRISTFFTFLAHILRKNKSKIKY